MLSRDARRPLNRWDYSSIRPGPVSSVGDVHLSARFKHSNPDLPIRWAPTTYGQREPFYGSNVTDGQWISYDSTGGPAATIDSNWGGRRDFRTNYGWTFQDARAEDRRVEPIVGETPQYSWNNKIATIYEARRTGDKFLPLPGPYIINRGEIARG